MNAATAVSTSSAPIAVSVNVQEIPLSRISESKTNPRRQFDETKLAELADNIRQYGVLQAILVRPIGTTDSFEVVAGTRRYRASKLAGRETIPATVRELTDTQCLELQLIENLQRSDVHELDEAQGYAALMQLQPENYTVETIATKVGRSEAYVYARLRLLHLIPEARQAFYEAKLTVAHAFEMARLQPNDQQRALQECFPQHRSAAAILKDKKAEAVTVRELRQWIEREIHLDLTNAPFDPQDEVLLPSAGACARCPKRTGSNPLLFPEVRQKSICTDRECYRAKVEALVQIRVKPLEEKGEKPLRVSQAPSWQANGHARDVLFEGQFLRAKSKSECPHTKPAVLIDGKGAGTIFHICRDEKCPVHSRITRYEPTPQERAQRAKERLAERVEKQSRFRILDAVRKKLPDALPRADVEMIALDYFRRLGHDNHRRLCRVYGWEEKKSKTSWGGQTVDYEKIATAAVEGMTAADLHRFLAVCVLVSDLYCPMFLDSTLAEKLRITFTFIDPGFGNLDAFRTHLDAYAGFLQRVPHFAFVFASPTAKLFPAADQLFQNKTNPPTGKLSEQVIRYFALRANWEAKRYELLKDSDIEFMNHARQCFAGEAFESAFAEWKAALISERDLVAVLETRARQKQEIRFSAYLLPRDYSSFGQNSHFLRKSA